MKCWLKRIFMSLLFLSAAQLSAAQLSSDQQSVAELGMKSLDYEACRSLVQQGEILSMSQLMELVSSLSDGKIIDTRLLQKEDLYIYEMEIAGTDGMVKMLYVDARSGALAESLIANTQ